MAGPHSAPPLVSVIIPAFNEARWIERTVRAVLGQQVHAGSFEVIVVDTGSTDGTGDIAASLPIRSYRVDQRSSYVARNLGISVASSDLLVFLDADCIPDEGWLAALIAPVYAGNVDYIAGRIENEIAIANIANRMLAYRTSADTRRASAMRGNVAAGNMLVHRRVFERIGVFEPVASGADIRQSRRAEAAGFRIDYAADAVVRHQCDLRVSDYLRRRYRITRGQGGRMRRMPAYLAHALRPGLREAGRLAREIGQPAWKTWLLLWAERWAESLGRIIGAARKHRRDGGPA